MDIVKPAKKLNKLLRTARRASRNGDHDEALSICRRGSARFPDELEFQLIEARTLLEQKRFGEAEQAFRNLIGLAPDSTDALVGLAQTYSRTNEWEKCVEVCAQADAGGVFSPPMVGLHGQALLERGRFGEAEEVYLKLAASAPVSPTGYLNLAKIYSQQRQWEKCISISAVANDNGIWHPQITRLQGQALMQLRRFEELRRLMSHYLQIAEVMTRHHLAGPAVNSRRVSPPALLDLYWKASVACGDYSGAERFQMEIAYARSQGAAMSTLFGDCAPYVPFFGNDILGDI